MKPAAVRPIVIGVIRKDESSILVAEGGDSIMGETSYRPLGGEIEHGEYSQQSLQREMPEELGKEIRVVRCLGTMENIFTFEGRSGHEIVIVYEAEFIDQDIYMRESLIGREDDGTPFKAIWKSPASFKAESTPLYPEGLLQLLEQNERNVIGR